jgi:hypothetical protein
MNAHVADLEYPSSDGLPLCENDLQLRWILLLFANLDLLVEDYVAGNMLWYPVQGRPKISMGPDVMVCLGRPKQPPRSSWRPWREEGVNPQVVFEEYYTYEPFSQELEVWLRVGGRLVQQATRDFTSPRLGIRLVCDDGGLVVYHPDGAPFRDLRGLSEHAAERLRALEASLGAELRAARAAAAWERARAAEAERQRVEAERRRVDAERQREEVSAQAEALSASLKAARAREEALAAKLRALGIDPDEPA